MALNLNAHLFYPYHVVPITLVHASCLRTEQDQGCPDVVECGDFHGDRVISCVQMPGN